MNRSMHSYEKAKIIMKQYKELLDAVGPQPISVVDKAESTLGFRLPPTYRQFVIEYGTAIFAGEEVYGVSSDNFTNASVPNAVWVTLQKRERSMLPSNFVVLYAVGEGTFLCLNVKGQRDEDCPVVEFVPGVQTHPLESPSFGEWFLDLIEQSLKDWEEDEDDEE